MRHTRAVAITRIAARLTTNPGRHTHFPVWPIKPGAASIYPARVDLCGRALDSCTRKTPARVHNQIDPGMSRNYPHIPTGPGVKVDDFAIALARYNLWEAERCGTPTERLQALSHLNQLVAAEIAGAEVTE